MGFEDTTNKSHDCVLQRLGMLFVLLFVVAQTISASHAGEDLLSEHTQTCAFCLVSDRDDDVPDPQKSNNDIDSGGDTFLSAIPEAMLLVDVADCRVALPSLVIVHQAADLSDIAPRAPPVMKQTNLFA